MNKELAGGYRENPFLIERTDSFVPSGLSSVGRERLQYMRNVGTEILARSFIALQNNNPELISTHRNTYAEAIEKFLPPISITIDPKVASWLSSCGSDRIITVVNHLPIQTMFGSTADALTSKVVELGGEDPLKNIPDNLKDNLPVEMLLQYVPELVINQFLSKPRSSVLVVAKYHPPLNVIQDASNSILLPWFRLKEGNGYATLLEGVKSAFSTESIPLIVCCPEGQQPETIENLNTYRTGIFSVAEKIASQQKENPLYILPMVLGIDTDLQIHASILPPVDMRTAEFTSREKIQSFAASIQNASQEELHRLQGGIGTYLWRGETNPAGFTESDLEELFATAS